MVKTALLMFAIATVNNAWAVDGVVLINQSSVAAAGGFPFFITQPGSYKLSSNITMNVTSAGNYRNCAYKKTESA